MTSSRKTNKALVTDLKEMEIYNLPDKEFKIIILKKLDERQNTGRQLNKIRKTMHEQNKNFNEEVETIKKNHAEILQLKNTMTELKNSIENLTKKA